MEGDERVTAPRILLYSSPVFGVFVPNVLISFYLLKFSTDVLLIAPATIGFLLMVAKFWDAVTDPATGWLSDRTQTPMGRRRPWFLACVASLWPVHGDALEPARIPRRPSPLTLDGRRYPFLLHGLYGLSRAPYGPGGGAF